METLNIFNNSFLKEGFKVYSEDNKTKYYKKHNIFSNVINQLIFIYGKENIIDPFLNNDENLLEKNFQLYGFSKEALEKWLRSLEALFRDNKKPNCFFEIVQEGIIDMYSYKVKYTKNITDYYQFEKLLYLSTNSNFMMRLYNLLHSKNTRAIDEYWQNCLFQLRNPIDFEMPVEYLTTDKYQSYGLTLEEVKKMSTTDIIKLNKKITESETSDGEVSGGRANKNDEVKKLVLATN
ncbi:MAG TPA: hypothetical protein PLX66_00300 [Bacilli bacterium]|nr:hypothetical protein [Bacilli bacterium]